MLKQKMTEKQLEEKIRNFMDRKMREYPELADKTLKNDMNHGETKYSPMFKQIIYRMH